MKKYWSEEKTERLVNVVMVIALVGIAVGILVLAIYSESRDIIEVSINDSELMCEIMESETDVFILPTKVGAFPIAKKDTYLVKVTYKGVTCKINSKELYNALCSETISMVGLNCRYFDGKLVSFSVDSVK